MEKVKKLLSASLILSFALLLLNSCQDDDEVNALDDGVLRVLASNINNTKFENGVENVKTDLSIELVFSHSLDTEKLASALSISSEDGNPVDYALEFTKVNSTVTISGNQGLEYLTTYSVELPSGTYGVNGEAIKDPVSLSFKTEAFTLPVVALSTDVIELKEDSETAVITASLDKTTATDVTINLAFGGSSTLDADYTVSSQSIVIPAGNLTGTTEITTNLDAENDDNETIVVSIDSVENANEGTTQEVTISILQELAPLALKGVMALTWDGSGTNDGKAVHVVANEDIADLSLYSLGVANNGEGTDGIEYTFPAISVSAGDDILVARSPDLISTYFGNCNTEFEHILQANNSISQNGDDAIELFSGITKIETYGDADVDGTGEVWEYKGSWAYKIGREWTYGGVDCSVGSSTTQDSSCTYPICKEALELKGVMALLWDGSGTNGGKAIHVKAIKDIPDLSIYGVGIANNGGGTDGLEFSFPAISVEEGDDILLAREPATLTAYFDSCINEFEHVIESNNSVSQNGDDAIELFKNEVVIETYGDPNVDGTGEGWEYSGTWAYKSGETWTAGILDCAVGSTTTLNSSCPYPLCN
ncbi:Ig-like domain-containing protein [Psychroflexus sp. YR1-1]|uniref:Ig-like domain-containing protein n=1 Tax=Psychroflexus aurantiacus TaxID=2709310 RepID=A0A6B3R3F1_9FLAO|nr:Ig-like domain-containing protein [Psychroflexus aurantiacus]NEV94578.1 Ig-like domain-containing protein [Psychroflexus aurantiacus]